MFSMVRDGGGVEAWTGYGAEALCDDQGEVGIWSLEAEQRW